MSADLALIVSRWEALPWPDTLRPGEHRRVLAELIDAHGAPGRHYHTLAHIAALLRLSADHRPSLDRADIVDLAIFFHDAVYDVARQDNEEASARLARTRLTALGRAPEVAGEVGRFIVATRHMAARREPARGDLGWFLDFDLSILAADRASYIRYADAIRREYATYDDAVYAEGRRRVLAAFLARPPIFRTPSLSERWEEAATNNLRWELSRLGET